MSTSIDYAARVARGIALLDEMEPDWLDEIELDALNLASVSACVLGRVYGDYEAGLRTLGMDLDADAEPVAHGFTLTVDEYDALRKELGASPVYSARVFAPLTAAWQEAISARLSA